MISDLVQDESFCCMSSAPAQYTPCNLNCCRIFLLFYCVFSGHLTRPQRNFMDVFHYDGVIDYTSEV